MSNANIIPLAKFFKEIMEPEDLSKVIDNVMWRYAYSYLQKSDDGVPEDTCTNLYYLRELRDTLMQMKA